MQKSSFFSFPRDEHRKRRRRRRRRRMAWMAATRYERCCSSRGLCYLRPRRCHRKVALASSSSSPSASYSSGPHDETFREFVTSASNSSAALGYNETTNVRGLFAERDITAEDEIFRVSLSEDDGRVFTDDSMNFDWSSSLAKQIIMLRRKRRRNRRIDDYDADYDEEELKTAYVNALPKEVIGIANKCCFYGNNRDDDARYELVSALFEAMGDHDAKTELMKYRKQVSSGDQEEEYGWAVSQVFSRTFRIEDAKGRRAPRRVMIPIADLLNHSSVDEEVNVTWRVTEDLSAFVIEAKRNIRKNEELILSYGERNDQHFLLFYGFLPNVNPDNSIVLWENVDECLNWYQELCGADENDTKWDTMKYKCKRTLGLLKKKDEGDVDDDDDGHANEERRRFILSPNAKVDNTTLLVLNEISGDNDMAIAAVRVRGEEILAQRFTSDEDLKIEIIFKRLMEETNMDETDVELLRSYRNRKRDILSEIV